MTYSFGNQPITGSAVSNFVNENLSWEKRKTMNIGLDLAFFNNRIEFTAEWYKNKSEDLLYGVPVPATLKNKVTSLGFGTETYRDPNNPDYITIVGEEVGQFYGYVYEGIARTQAELDAHNAVANQPGANVGDCIYKDMNGDSQITDEDRVVLGGGLPKINFGLSAHLEYKNFDLSISTYGALNYHVADGIYNNLNSCYDYGNKDVDILGANHW